VFPKLWLRRRIWREGARLRFDLPHLCDCSWPVAPGCAVQGSQHIIRSSTENFKLSVQHIDRCNVYGGWQLAAVTTCLQLRASISLEYTVSQQQLALLRLTAPQHFYRVPSTLPIPANPKENTNANDADARPAAAHNQRTISEDVLAAGPSSLVVASPLALAPAQMPASVENRKGPRTLNALHDRYSIREYLPTMVVSWFRSSSYTQVEQTASAYPARMKQAGMSEQVSTVSMSPCPFLLFETLIRSRL
jgi:hypothetical protein